MLDKLRLEDFSGRIGDKFQVKTDTGDGPELELLEAAGTAGTQLERPPFSIVFGASPGEIAEQCIFTLEHPEMGAFDLFLVPLTPERCEAVFT
jgi:hypothetical protein